MVFAGHDLIAENGTLLAETAPFAGGIAETEIDCQRMEAERARNTSFELSRDGYTTVEFDLELTETPHPLDRPGTLRARRPSAAPSAAN